MPAPDEQNEARPLTRTDRTSPVPPVRRATGIYGLIVTASVLASAGTSLGTLPLAVAVFVTLLVYWLAEEYAELGEGVTRGQLPGFARIRSHLREKWPLVSASYLPLLAMVAARIVGATASTAALVGLIMSVVLLVVYGWLGGRAAGLRGLSRLGMTAIAGGLGLLLIVLKVSLAQLK